MRRLWLSLVLVFLPTLVCKADMLAINDPTINTQIHQNLLRSNTLEKVSVSSESGIRFATSSLRFDNGPAHKVKIDHGRNSQAEGLFALEKTAEATSLPSDLTVKDLEKLCNSINQATGLDDLKLVLSQGYFQILDTKVKTGASQYVVLAMIQAMRPQSVEIMDFNVGQERGAVSVKGRSYFGPVSGLVYVIKQDGLWKIEKEDWYAGGKETKDYIASTFNPLTGKNKFFGEKSAGFMSQLSPDSRVNPNVLALSRAPYHKNGRSINFVFMMKKAKTTSDRSPGIYGGSSDQGKGQPRAPMHVMWTGSKRLMPEQKVVDVNTPVDFSIANYDDGYSPGQWNFIIPTKKPREITVSMLWNF